MEKLVNIERDLFARINYFFDCQLPQEKVDEFLSLNLKENDEMSKTLLKEKCIISKIELISLQEDGPKRIIPFKEGFVNLQKKINELHSEAENRTITIYEYCKEYYS